MRGLPVSESLGKAAQIPDRILECVCSDKEIVPIGNGKVRTVLVINFIAKACPGGEAWQAGTVRTVAVYSESWQRQSLVARVC